MATDQSVRDYGLAAPHGPNVTGQHVATADVGDMSNAEASVFRTLLLPDDSYNEEGIYWADLPMGKRIAFVNKVNNAEAAKEFKATLSMARADPGAPFTYYLRNMVIPGLGLFLEGYVLFSIGNLSALFAIVWPHCWGKVAPTVCEPVWVESVQYLEVTGIILGQIIVGIIGDWLGRRWGLLQDCFIMFLGLVMLTCAWGTSFNGWVACYSLSLLVYGVGVGGEYPMTATSGMENAVGSGKLSTREDRLHRGRKTTSAFLMQGWGQFFNQVVLILSLIIFNSGSGNPPYDEGVAQWTYRISFALPAAGTLWLLYYRAYKMRSASKQLMIAKKKQSVTGYDSKSLSLTFTYFGPRVIATAFGWFANDVFFYGNKLFQSQFIAVIEPNEVGVTPNWLWNLINIVVELAGYYMASFLIDHKLYGRKWMQIIGFLVCFICFAVPAFDYAHYSTVAIHQFQAMYFISSFFNQFGPNAVTFLVAAEVYPTPVRASAHGFSAACGKLGALMTALLGTYISDIRTRFLILIWFGLGGALTTFLFLPDTTGLDLKESERRWAFIRDGRESEYHGIAIHPKHLSFWERIRGVGKHYNAEEDYKQRVEEMRADWESAMARRAAEKEGALDDGDEDMADDWSDEVSTFFERTKGKNDGKATSPFAQGVGLNGSPEEIKEKDENGVSH